VKSLNAKKLQKAGEYQFIYEQKRGMYSIVPKTGAFAVLSDKPSGHLLGNSIVNTVPSVIDMLIDITRDANLVPVIDTGVSVVESDLRTIKLLMGDQFVVAVNKEYMDVFHPITMLCAGI